ERVAGRERHVWHVGGVPGRDDEPARIGIRADLLDHLADLVDLPAARGGPGTPLHAIDGSELPVLIRPFVPDGDAVLAKPLHVALAAQEPEQLDRDGLEVHPLGGDEREALSEVEADLATEDAAGAGAGAI